MWPHTMQIHKLSVAPHTKHSLVSSLSATGLSTDRLLPLDPSGTGFWEYLQVGQLQDVSGVVIVDKDDATTTYSVSPHLLKQ